MTTTKPPLTTPGDILRALADLRGQYGGALIDLQVDTLRQAAAILDGDEFALTSLAPSWTWNTVPEVLTAAQRVTAAAATPAPERPVPTCRPGLDEDALTARQVAQIKEMLAEARDEHGVEVEFRNLAFRFDDESRPGRGRAVQFVFADADHVFAGGMDVYGGGWMSVGDLNWTHDSANEECPCAMCESEREDEEADETVAR